MALNIIIKGFKLRVINAYSPTNIDGTQHQKDDFYKTLEKACVKTEKHFKIVIAGDFNAKTSIVLKKCFFDETTVIEDNECNENGDRLKTFCRSKKLRLLQTYFEHPLVNQYTWYSNDKITKRVLDYVLTEKYVQQYATNCIVDPQIDFESDHRLLITDFSTPTSKLARRKTPCKKHHQKVNVKSLRKPEIQSAYAEAVRGEFKRSVNTSATDLSDNIINSLTAAANTVLPNTDKEHAREVWKEDDIFNSLINERRKHNRNSDQHQVISKEIKKRIRHLKNDKLRREAEAIDVRVQKRELEELYRCFKNDNSTFREAKTDVTCDPAKLKEHFVKHFNAEEEGTCPIELQDAPIFVRNLQDISIDDINSEPPSKDEIIKTLSSLKPYKAANDIPTAFIKYAMECDEVVNEMEMLYRTIWRTQKLPSKWQHSRLVTIWKGASKGKATDPKAYRGLQIGSTMSKIMVTIILNRLKGWYHNQLLEQQQGFRPGRGTTDGIFIIKRIQEIFRKMGKSVYALFIDLSAAFDKINRAWMFKSISQRLSPQCNKKLFELLESIYSYTTTALSQDPNGIFALTLGVRQGGPESPTLYNLYMDYVMRIFMKRCEEENIKFVSLSYSMPANASTSSNFGLGRYGTQLLDWIGYADDLALIFPDFENLNRGTNLLKETLERYQLTVNLDKTKTMIMNYHGNEYPKSITQVNGIDIENVETFSYLGCQINFQQVGTGDEELNLRVDSATSRFYALSKKMFNQNISLSVRVRIMNALVRTRLTYGCATWSLTKRQRERICAEYNTILRKMTRGGFRRKPDSYSFVHSNEHLYQIGRTESLNDYIMKQQRAYIAHVIRDDDETITKKLLFNNDAVRIPGRNTTFMKTVSEQAGCSIKEFIDRAMKKEY